MLVVLQASWALHHESDTTISSVLWLALIFFLAHSHGACLCLDGGCCPIVQGHLNRIVDGCFAHAHELIAGLRSVLGSESQVSVIAQAGALYSCWDTVRHS